MLLLSHKLKSKLLSFIPSDLAPAYHSTLSPNPVLTPPHPHPWAPPDWSPSSFQDYFMPLCLSSASPFTATSFSLHVQPLRIISPPKTQLQVGLHESFISSSPRNVFWPHMPVQTLNFAVLSSHPSLPPPHHHREEGVIADISHVLSTLHSARHIKGTQMKSDDGRNSSRGTNGRQETVES